MQLAQLAEAKQHPRNKSPQLQNQKDDLQSCDSDEQGILCAIKSGMETAEIGSCMLDLACFSLWVGK